MVQRKAPPEIRSGGQDRADYARYIVEFRINNGYFSQFVFS